MFTDDMLNILKLHNSFNNDTFGIDTIFQLQIISDLITGT